MANRGRQCQVNVTARTRLELTCAGWPVGRQGAQLTATGAVAHAQLFALSDDAAVVEGVISFPRRAADGTVTGK
jgi:hypothetical protein